MAIALQEQSLITQSAAAEGIYQATKGLPELPLRDILTDPEVIARNFCAFSALATATDAIRGAIVTPTPTEISISVGELVALTLREHNGDYHGPWFAITNDGGTYHQAIVSAAEGLGLAAQAKIGFKKIEEFQDYLSESHETPRAMLLSVDNRFINEQTLPTQRRQQDNLQPGTHVIAILSYDPVTDLYSVFDPYGKQETQALSAERINRYISYNGNSTKAIALAAERNAFRDINAVADTPNIRKNTFLIATLETLVKSRKR